MIHSSYYFGLNSEKSFYQLNIYFAVIKLLKELITVAENSVKVRNTAAPSVKLNHLLNVINFTKVRKWNQRSFKNNKNKIRKKLLYTIM